MFALKAGQGRRSEEGVPVWSRISGDFVMPRWLRRPVRFFVRFASGEVEVPRYAATMATAVLFGATAAYGTVVGGHTPAVVKAVTARTGFAIDEIKISGNREISEIDVFQSIGLDGWTSLIGFDADNARERVLAMPWVESASVRKIYPSGLEVEIVEKTPFAIWQHGRQLTLIEKDGSPIAPYSGRRHADLPLVIGLGAAEDAADFVTRVAEFPELAGRVKGYIRVSQRRWNLRLDNGVTVKLPARGEDAALRELVRLDREQELLSRDIQSVDLRLEDRLVVRLSSEAASAREAAMKEQLGKKYHPAERRI